MLSIQRRNNPLKWCNLWYIPQIDLRSRTAMENANSTFTHKHQQSSFYHSSIRHQQQLESIYKRRISSSFLWSGGINPNSFQGASFFFFYKLAMIWRLSSAWARFIPCDMRVILKEKKKREEEWKWPYWSVANILRTKEMETERQVSKAEEALKNTLRNEGFPPKTA